MPQLVFTVTNDLVYDQRMQRICSSLAIKGFDVLLVGRSLKKSEALSKMPFAQKRLFCFFEKGKLFYIEYNVRLFLFLLFTRMQLVCAIDLDTILPCLLASKLKGIKRVYDAHELFTELKEVMSRPAIYRFWLKVERYAVPKFSVGYTVNQFIKEELQRRYGVDYQIVRNMPVLQPENDPALAKENLIQDLRKLTNNAGAQKLADCLKVGQPFLLYQGAVNEGRSFETLVPAMQAVNGLLVICGDGNLMETVKELAAQYQVNDKIIFMGMLQPALLRQITPFAYLGLTLFENKGLNQYYSLANRFFDYVQAGIPQLCVGYPEYKAINDQYGIAHLVPDTEPTTLSQALNFLLVNTVIYKGMVKSCQVARLQLSWQKEEERLISLYQNCLQSN
jgi:glycosyltransferase involved in cell wall biosynthesis